MSDHSFQPETLAIHAGQIPDAATGARALPIYQTTSFVFDSAEHAASLFNLQTFGNVYSRLSNPTVAALEERVAALEGGRAGLASASGMAAESMALMTLLQQGDHVVAAGALYGGSVTMLAVNLARYGIDTTFVDASSPDAFAAAMRPNTRAVFAESLGNPSLAVLDMTSVADVAHAHGVPLIIDNTVPSPYLCNPIRFGADIVVHSATKYLGGHGTTLAGVMVEGGKFPWDNGKFPGMTDPSPGYHGVKFFETFGDFAFMMRARMEHLRVYGAALSATSAWQILQGVETLPLRMERHCTNALKVAQFLQSHPAVSWVNYPGLPEHPQHALVLRPDAQREWRQQHRPWQRGRCVGPAGVRREGRVGGGREVHRVSRVHEPPGQHRRHAHPHHPPRVHHAPPAGARPATGRRREARHGAHVGGAGKCGRHPVGH
jgi:O-acetylhomoserine (thiol)-lyase